MRCLIISNRLPLSYVNKSFKESSGGLVSAIKGIDPKKGDYEFHWYGILSNTIQEEELQVLNNFSIPCHAVLVDDKDYDNYYNKFSNDVLWPIFHYEHRSQRLRSTESTRFRPY